MFGQNLIKDGNWTIPRPSIFASGHVSFAATFIPGSKYLLPTEKMLISNTADESVYLNEERILF